MPARKYRLLVENPDVLSSEDVNSIRVRVRAQSNVTLATPGATIDGVTMAAGQEFMADQQSSATEDGAYVWNGASVAATRSLKMPTGSKVGGMIVSVKEGTDGNKAFLVTNDETADIVGTNGITLAASTTSGGTTSAGSSHGHTFTGTAPTAAEVDATSGTGWATSGQVVTTSENFTATLNQYAGCWFLGATKTPCLIVSHPAVTGAPLVLTVTGAAPSTAAEAFRVLKAPTPVGTNATESSHTHTT